MTIPRTKFSVEKNRYFKNKILYGEKWPLQEQNSPWRTMVTSRKKFSMQKKGLSDFLGAVLLYKNGCPPFWANTFYFALLFLCLRSQNVFSKELLCNFQGKVKKINKWGTCSR